MNTLTKKIAGITFLAIASAPAHSMSWAPDELHESHIAPSPLAEQASDAFWAPEDDSLIDAYMPIGNDLVADLNNSEDSHWIQ